MARLREETLERFEDYGDRILALAEVLEKGGRSKRLVDQLIGSGTSAGANAFEAAEAMSKADFIKCLCITAKELYETVYWIRLIMRRRYVAEKRLDALLKETRELLAIVKVLIARAKSRKSSAG